MFRPWQRSTLLKSLTTVVATALLVVAAVTLQPPTAKAQPPAQDQQQDQANNGKPNILVIFGDDVGISNISAYSMGLVGYRTPNIDRIAKEGANFTDFYGQHCGRSKRPPTNVGRQ